MEFLSEKIKLEKSAIRKYAPDTISIPLYVSSNLKYEFFYWQREAFENLLIYENDHKENPSHLMFNMATGTGKTLLMASLILFYYKKGYRKFIFFVNQNNIVDKTENNFINSFHSKYLFNERIVIDDRIVNIKKVNNFSTNNDSIEIIFTTIQKLYNDIHIVKENKVYLDDLIKKDIVMLADEAHHLNTDTLNLKEQKEIDFVTELRENASQKEIERRGWEHTVIDLLFKKNGDLSNNKNILLEFTATIQETPKVIEKYANKIIYKFDIKDFLLAGYTKEINLISSTLNKKERILQALLFNWYRSKIAIRNGIENFKPVILFRSKTIEDSKNDYLEFKRIIYNLTKRDFDFLNDIDSLFNQTEELYDQGKSRLLDVINLIKDNKIGIEEIIDFIQYNFSDVNCIITNSENKKDFDKKKRDDLSQTENDLLNSLEDKNNHIRAIFTVNRLTEGWDVLNLFDIVRLYKGRDEGRDSKGNRSAGSSTIAEVQLIGRGVRYFPFNYKDLLKNKRKFDNELTNEMRVLEELYYHSDSDHRYIDELKRELKNRGFIVDGRVRKQFKLKKDFTETDFYREIKIWKNERISNPNRRRKNIDELKSILSGFKFNLTSLNLKEQELDFSEEEDRKRLEIGNGDLKTIPFKIKDIDKHIFYKVINSKAKEYNSLFKFENLKKELSIDSIEDFRENFIADCCINVVVSNIRNCEDISNKEKYNILSSFFDYFLIEFKKTINPDKGTEFCDYKFEEIFSEPKYRSIKKDEESQLIEEELIKEDWYVLDSFYGTSEEKGLIQFIKETIGNLKQKYEEVYFLRNEEQYKIYDFNTGRGFQPDFLLFFKEAEKVYYQVFIEPKGDNLLEKDQWKEDFLKQVTDKYKGQVLKYENRNYILIGLPLFNKGKNYSFIEEYNNLID
ncbi:DEAD/DEAH box helicase family protein [Minisyncoccus archaeophilus]|uniref:DEAD/DEAH box helicase family protein n=1 Tax=Minisyncoccus archaeiphilus TaxID=3238481 RepID=UPI00399D0291